MFTDICFNNLSLNRYLPEVTLFQNASFENSGELMAWKVIKKCNYQWRHPFRIYWGYAYQLFDGFGNFSYIMPLDSENLMDIQVSHSKDQLGLVHFIKRVSNKIMGVNLIKNQRVISSQIFNNGNTVSFVLSNRFYVCADLRVKQGHIIHSGHLNMTKKQFSLKKRKKIQLVMKGGQPGPNSTPLTFILS